MRKPIKFHPSGFVSTRIAFLLLFLSLGSVVSMAQSLTDGSIYSRFGIGERRFFHSSLSQAMGGGGIGLGSLRYVNYANPASWSSEELTRLSAGFLHETITSEAAGSDKGRLSSGSLNAISVGFPLYRNRTGLAFSFAPYTRVSYRVDVPGSISSDPDSNDEELYTTSFKGNGGLQRLTGGIGHRFNEFLSVGVAVDYIFGILEETQRTSFGSADYVDLDVVQATRLSGPTATLGVRFTTTGLLGETDALHIGAVFTLPTTLSGRRVFTLDSIADSDTLGSGGSGDVSIPLSAGLGLVYQPNPRWTLVSDIQVERWDNFDSDFTFPGFVPSSGKSLNNRIRASGGFEYWPVGGRPFGSYFERMAYRMGIYTDESYVTPVPGQHIPIYGVTGGLSLPSLIPGTTIDLNFDIGRRGSTDNGLVRDTFLRFGVNVNFGERWFNRLPLG